jgi:hypothetical protein
MEIMATFRASLIAVQPVASPRAQLFRAFNSPDSGRKFRTQQPRISRLIGETPDRGKPLVYGACRQVKRLEMQPDLRTTVRLRASRGSEQYQVMNCSIANL